VRGSVRLPHRTLSRGLDADGVLRVYDCAEGSRTVDELVQAARGGDAYAATDCLDLYLEIEAGRFPGVDRAPAPLRDFALGVLASVRDGADAPAALGLALDGRLDEQRENWHRDFDLAASVRERQLAGDSQEEAVADVAAERAVSESTVRRALASHRGAVRVPKLKPKKVPPS